MGNCLKAQAADDMSLLPGSDAGRFSASSDQLGIPPTYDPEVIMSVDLSLCFQGQLSIAVVEAILLSIHSPEFVFFSFILLDQREQCDNLCSCSGRRGKLLEIACGISETANLT